MNRIEVEISEREIRLSEIDWEALQRPDCGASDVFFGMVRNRNHGREVLGVSYDAFEPLARRELHKISEEALRSELPNAHGTVFIRHRTGNLKVGEVSVVIAVFTPHRAEAFQVCRKVIEELKKRAPIWKKETYRDGESEWLQGHALCSSHGGGV